MKDKHIYLIRHGETQYNKLGLVQGSGIDASLNERGMQQAEAFYQYFKEVPFDKVYTSKLVRTHQSVAKFIERLPWQTLEGLNEISWGYKEGRIITDEDDRQHYEMMSGWLRGEYHHKVPGGESPLDVYERQKVAWQYIMSHPSETYILVCMHGRAMRILLCLLLEKELSEMDSFSHHNLCLYLLKYHAATQKYTLERADYTDHLVGLPEDTDLSPNLVK